MRTYLFLLRPILETKVWDNPDGKVFGVVVRAQTKTDARQLAANNAGIEGPQAWMDSRFSVCLRLENKGAEGVLILDKRVMLHDSK